MILVMICLLCLVGILVSAIMIGPPEKSHGGFIEFPDLLTGFAHFMNLIFWTFVCIVAFSVHYAGLYYGWWN